MKRYRALIWIAALGLLFAVMDEALARVGGGHSYGGGSSRSSGGSSGGGGGDGGLLVYLLIRLCIEYPAVGIPLVIVIGIAVLWHERMKRQGPATSDASQHTVSMPTRTRNASYRQAPQRKTLPRRSTPAPSGARARKALLAADPSFSEPAFRDWTQLVIRRAHESLSQPDHDALKPFVDPAVFQTLTNNFGSAKLDQLAVGALSVTSVDVRHQQTTMHLQITYAVRIAGTSRKKVEAFFTFKRPTGVISLAPDEALRLGCPSCGAAVQCDPMGRCTHCGSAIEAGQLQWRAVSCAITRKSALPTPEHGPYVAEEAGYRVPSVMSPNLAAEFRAFGTRHPNLDTQAWEARVHAIFHKLQQAWSDGRWDDARPYTTDSAWNTLRFWMLQYKEAGEFNRMDKVKILKMQVVRVEVDAWYEAITVRFWASAHDYTEDANGKVVSGSKKKPRKFSEYWTILRAVGSGDASHDPNACPSCGAPLDNVNAAGVCGYCDSVITTGKFDWVLSQIEQATEYSG